LLPYLPHLNTKKIVLASASPRRHELLAKQLGLRFEVVVSSFEETLDKSKYRWPDGEGAARYAIDTAKGKALDVYRVTMEKPTQIPDLLIGADTVVEHDGDILEKPDDADMARSMLSRLSGGQHHVHTGVVIILPKAKDASGTAPYIKTFASTTTVQFDSLGSEVIDEYIKSGEPFGKAGSYGIQGIAGSFVKGIDGCFFNVMGFPVHRFAVELAALVKQGKLPMT